MRCNIFLGTIWRFWILAVGAIVVWAGAAHAEVRIDITRGKIEPMPIALPTFASGDPRSAAIGEQIRAVMSADLERSGLFAPIDQAAYAETLPAIDVRPKFSAWSTIRAQALTQGAVKSLANGRIRIEFRLWDVPAGRQLTAQAYETAGDNWRRVSHLVADEIYKRLTGEGGYFDTRIAYISESGPPDKRVKRLAIMDQDGANHRYLSDGSSLTLTPRFSPTAQKVAYLSYDSAAPRVYLLDLATGRRHLLGHFPGMTFAPRFAPDGSKMILSMTRDGNSELYEMDLNGDHVKRLTHNPAIDTSPDYSPDGTRVVFNSDRSGAQQLYVMDLATGDTQRISFGDGRYATPTWSPRGDQIAFTKMDGSGFHIGVMRPDGSGERLLTQAFLTESPTWAPNGRVLMFYRQDANGAAPTLHTIDLTGFNEREVPTPRGASDPAWSPLLP